MQGMWRAAIACLLLSLPLQPSPLSASTCAINGGGTRCSSGQDPGSSQSSVDGRSQAGNPFDVITGNKYQYELDYLAADSALRFSRHYNSALEAIDTGLGHGWRHSYMVRLVFGPGDNHQIAQSDGRLLTFTRTTDDSQNASAAPEFPQEFDSPGNGILIRLDALNSLWHTPEGNTLHFYGSFLVQLDAAIPAGSILTLHYEGRRLARVSDEQGQTLNFTYSDGNLNDIAQYLPGSGNVPGHLQTVQLPNGNTIDFRYDNTRNLASVSGDRSATVQYRYTASGYPHHLTLRQLSEFKPAMDETAWRMLHQGLVDEQAKPYWTLYDDPPQQQPQTTRWGYDSEGRVNTFRPADSKGNLDISYAIDTSDGHTTGRTTLHLEGNAWRRYQWHQEGNQRAVIERIDYQDCEDCKVRGFVLGERDTGIQNRAWPREEREYQGRPTPPVLSQPCGLPAGVNCADLERDMEMAALSSCAYDDVCTIPGWRRVTYQELGYQKEDFKKGGFYATVFENTITGEWTLAFRGTGFTDYNDLFADIRLTVGAGGVQFDRATELTKKLKRDYPNISISYTGHSLGGALATSAALIGNGQATVFNTAWMNEETANKYNLNFDAIRSHVEHIHIEGEIVQDIQSNFYGPVHIPRTNTVSHTKRKPQFSGYQVKPKNTSDGSISRHRMNNVIQSLDYLHTNNCNRAIP